MSPTRSTALALASVGFLALACRSSAEDDSPGAASAEPAAPSPSSRLHAVGELGHARDYSMSVEGTKECPMDPPFRPKRGFAKIGVEVELEGTSALEVPVNPFYATLKEPSGEPRTVTLAGCEPVLPSVRVTRGKKVRGFVTFEVPLASRRFELRYAPPVIGPGVEELRFGVGR